MYKSTIYHTFLFVRPLNTSLSGCSFLSTLKLFQAAEGIPDPSICFPPVYFITHSAPRPDGANMNTVNSHCIAESHRCKPPASHSSLLTALETNTLSSSERLLCGKHKQNLNRALCACVDVYARDGELRGREMEWERTACSGEGKAVFQCETPRTRSASKCWAQTEFNQMKYGIIRKRHTERNGHNKSGLIVPKHTLSIC